MNPEKRRAERRRVAKTMARNPGNRKAKFLRLEQTERDKRRASERFDAVSTNPLPAKKPASKKQGIIGRLFGKDVPA